MPSSSTLKVVLLSGAVAWSAATGAMEYVPVKGQDGKIRRFSRLIMGTDHLVQSGWVSSGQPEPTADQVALVLDEAARLGINLFDTAPIYVGGVENLLGKWRAARQQAVRSDKFYARPGLNPDRELYALSKGGFPFDLFWLKQLPAGCHSIELIEALKKANILPPDAGDWQNQALPLMNVPPGTYASHLYCDPEIMVQRIAQELSHTRKNLEHDIDVYLMHRDDGDAVAFQRVLRAMTPVERILTAVSARAIASQFGLLGWSNWATERVNESLRLADSDANLLRPMINSPYFSLFEMSERTIHALGVQVTHAEMTDPEFQKGIKIMPYSPLGGFSILDQPEPKWENARSRAFEKFVNRDPYWMNVYPAIFTKANEERWRRANTFLHLFNSKHRTAYTIDQLLNAYVLAHPRTDMLAIGAITVEQVRRTVGALEMAKMLSREDLDHLYSGTQAPTLGKSTAASSSTGRCSESLR